VEGNRLPTDCPSCGETLAVVKLSCGACGTAVEGRFALPVLSRLDVKDQAFVLSLLKSSGSLKDLAGQYGISYPTVRNRLDELIEKVGQLEAEAGKEEGG